jgi:hypothetical protein
LSAKTLLSTSKNRFHHLDLSPIFDIKRLYFFIFFMSDSNQKHTPPELNEDFNVVFGEQTRVELTEAEQEFLRILDQEKDQQAKKS